MGFLHCCGALRHCDTFTLIPQNGYLLAELDVLECCPVCGHFGAQVTRINHEHQVSIVRKSNIAARKLVEKLGTSILFKQKYRFSPLTQKGSFYLSYNEYGIKKRCYSNISALQMGRKDPYEGLGFTNPITAGRKILLKPKKPAENMSEKILR